MPPKNKDSKPLPSRASLMLNDHVQVPYLLNNRKWKDDFWPKLSNMVNPTQQQANALFLETFGTDASKWSGIPDWNVETVRGSPNILSVPAPQNSQVAMLRHQAKQDAMLLGSKKLRSPSHAEDERPLQQAKIDEQPKVNVIKPPKLQRLAPSFPPSTAITVVNLENMHPAKRLHWKEKGFYNFMPILEIPTINRSLNKPGWISIYYDPSYVDMPEMLPRDYDDDATQIDEDATEPDDEEFEE